MIEGVERSGDARAYVKDVLDRGERLMGFGHRVYRAYDPRAAVLRDTCKRLGAPRYEVALELEQAALTELRERQPDRVLETNVDYWAAVLLDFADVPGDDDDAAVRCRRAPPAGRRTSSSRRSTGRLIRPSRALHRRGPARARRRQGLPGLSVAPVCRVAGSATRHTSAPARFEVFRYRDLVGEYLEPRASTPQPFRVVDLTSHASGRGERLTA